MFMSVQHQMEICDVAYITVWIFPSNSTFHISLNFFKLVFCGFGQGLSTRHAVIIQRLEKGKIIIFDIFFLGNKTVLF